MKLLLTSAGITNNTIFKSLEKLVGKTAAKIKIAFIPTASNIEEGSKDWLIEDLNNLVKHDFEVDIVDISALPKNIWLARLEVSDVLLFGGGNTFHLMHWVNKSGLAEILIELLETRVYVGISAGSCITGRTIYNSVQNLFGERYEVRIEEGLSFVNFQTIPHLNSPYFEKIRKENLEIAAKSIGDTVYALDDNSAIVVDGDKIEVVSEGEWLKFN